MTSHLKIVSVIHTWIANKLQEYLVSEYLWDNKIQKAYGEGTFTAIRELMEVINIPNRDTCIGFMDIKNAYGSINRDFILRVMKEYNVPLWIQNYFRAFYSKLRIKITGCVDDNEKNYDENNYDNDQYLRMEVGILQGDHLSNIVFVMCLSYIIMNVQIIMWKEHKYKNAISAFVDDIAFLNHQFDLIPIVITTFIKVCRSCNSGLEFNFPKSVIMIVDRRMITDSSYTSYRQQILSKYPSGVPIVIDDEIIGVIRINETNELIRYLGVLVDSSADSYGLEYSTIMTNEMTNQFSEAEKIMIKRFGKDKDFKKVNGSHHKLGFIVKKIFNYIVGRTSWKLDRLFTTRYNKSKIEVRLSNVMRHYARRWNVDVKSITIKSYESKTLNIKNSIRVILLEAEDPTKAQKKVKAIDDMVLRLVEGKFNAFHSLEINKFSNPYESEEI